MDTLALPLDLHALEKLRAEELEEARSIQAEMLPAESLHAGPVTISHEFKPIAAVGGDFLATFNRRLLIRGMPRRHAAIQYAVFDPRSRDLHVASAGMPGPFHLCADGCRALELSGIPPGLFADTCYETLTVRLSPGDSVLFCTDGITDAFDAGEEQFGVE